MYVSIIKEMTFDERGGGDTNFTPFVGELNSRVQKCQISFAISLSDSLYQSDQPKVEP